jgi:hypothetical protein
MASIGQDKFLTAKISIIDCGIGHALRKPMQYVPNTLKGHKPHMVTQRYQTQNK